MYGLSIWQQYNPQIPPTYLQDWGPATNSPVLLSDLLYRVVNHPLNPLKLDYRSVWALAHGFEVSGELHSANSNSGPTTEC